MKSILFAVALSVGAMMPVAPATAQLVVGEAANLNVLPEGTAVPLRTLTELSSKRSRVGDRFDLEVSEDVLLNGRVVIPMGSSAVGEITRRTGKGMFGKSGKLETRLLYVKVGNQQIRIGGQGGDRGKGGTAGTVATLVFAWPAAFFVTGTSAVVEPGTQMVGYLEADLPVVFTGEAAPVAPLVVPAPSDMPAATTPVSGAEVP